MKYIKNNKNLYLIGLVILILLISVTIILLILNKNSTGNLDNHITNNSQEDIISNVNSFVADYDGIDVSTWRTYTFNQSYVIPNFSLKYPSEWEESFCKASGCWDINLTKGSRELLIDISGQSKSTFEQSLRDWITNFGSYDIKYNFEVLEQDSLTNGNRKFIIYEVTEEGELPYILSIVDAAEMYEGRGHLALKIMDNNDLDLLKKVLESIK